MKVGWLFKLGLLLWLMVWFRPQPLLAQTYPLACPPIFAATLSLTEKFTQTDAVFVGVIQGHLNPNHDIPLYDSFVHGYGKVRHQFSLPLPHLNSYPTYTTFQVEQSWKGVAYKRITITTYSTGYQQPWMKAPAGSRWLILANERDGRWHTACGLAYELDTAAELNYPPFTAPTIPLKASWSVYLPLYATAVVLIGGLLGRRWFNKHALTKG